MRLHHLVTRALHLASSVGSLGDEHAKFPDRQTDASGEIAKLDAQLGDTVAVVAGQRPPARRRQPRDGGEPARVELGTDMPVVQILAGNAATVGEPQQLAVDPLQSIALALQLGDQVGNPILVEVEARRLGGKGFQQGVQPGDGALRHAAPATDRRQPPLAERGNLLGERGHGRKARHDIGQQLDLADRQAVGSLVVGGLRGLGLAGNNRAVRGRGRRTDGAARLPGRIARHFAIRHRHVDQIAQAQTRLAEIGGPGLHPPHDERRAAKRAQKRELTGLDALGEGDLGLARQQLAVAHVAKIGVHQIPRGRDPIGRLVLGERRNAVDHLGHGLRPIPGDFGPRRLSRRRPRPVPALGADVGIMVQLDRNGIRVGQDTDGPARDGKILAVSKPHAQRRIHKLGSSRPLLRNWRQRVYRGDRSRQGTKLLVSGLRAAELPGTPDSAIRDFAVRTDGKRATSATTSFAPRNGTTPSKNQALSTP